MLADRGYEITLNKKQTGWRHQVGRLKVRTWTYGPNNRHRSKLKAKAGKVVDSLLRDSSWAPKRKQPSRLGVVCMGEQRLTCPPLASQHIRTRLPIRAEEP